MTDLVDAVVKTLTAPYQIGKAIHGSVKDRKRRKSEKQQAKEGQRSRAASANSVSSLEESGSHTTPHPALRGSIHQTDRISMYHASSSSTINDLNSGSEFGSFDSIESSTTARLEPTAPPPDDQRSMMDINNNLSGASQYNIPACIPPSYDESQRAYGL